MSIMLHWQFYYSNFYEQSITFLYAAVGDCCNTLEQGLKPGLHIVVMVVSTVANMFLTLFQAVLIHVNTSITTSQA